MLFQSQSFVLLFLPLVLLGFWLLAGRKTAHQWLLIAASIVFYGWWDIRFLPLLIGHAALTWIFAAWYHRSNKAWIVWLAVALNLTSLATFKYLTFLVDNLESVTGIVMPRSEIILPIGISFFTFQLISYLVDLKRGNAALYPFRTFFLFATFFPQLIAGPIVRHNQIIGQFSLDPFRAGLQRRIAAGLALFTLGFAKKVLLADKLAEKVDPVFLKAQAGMLSFGEAWTGTLGFSFQLFLDFSAYSEMAIGLGLLFGLQLPENFNRPYLATSLRDFWRRWHITLSLFLRDYLYIPLGGSRRGTAAYIGATMATMGLCGLWHGAGWTFVIWGLLHGAGLIVCRAWQKSGLALPAPAGWVLTMTFVMAGWVIFRSPDFSTAWNVMASATGFNGVAGKLDGTVTLGLAALVSLAVPSSHAILEKTLLPSRIIACAAALLLVVCILEVGNEPAASFIYFQF